MYIMYIIKFIAIRCKFTINTVNEILNKTLLVLKMINKLHIITSQTYTKEQYNSSPSNIINTKLVFLMLGHTWQKSGRAWLALSEFGEIWMSAQGLEQGTKQGAA